MTEAFLIKKAVTKPDFKETRLLPLFPELAHHELIWLGSNLALKIFLPNLPAAEDAKLVYPKYPDLPAKIKIAGKQVRFDYHDATELKPTS